VFLIIMKITQVGDYYWTVFTEPMLDLANTVIQSHIKSFLHITSFDSGPLRINDEEKIQGWQQMDTIAVSPSLNQGTEVPYDNYDEWYISQSTLEFPDSFEVFVNYGSFTLEDPKVLTKNDDKTWERGRFDFLDSMQERFWNQINIIKPDTYLAAGDRDVLVSKN